MKKMQRALRSSAVLGIVVVCATQTVFAQLGGPINPVPTTYTQERIIAGHLLRRMGFGPTREDVNRILAMGATAYIDEQLNPDAINDADAEALLPVIPLDEYSADEWSRRWYTRMVYSRRQLQEKMTLIWHEHFATSASKVGFGLMMANQEATMRRNALGNFRQMIVDMSTDNAMLLWLDNNDNDGQAVDGDGNPIPPNENYAREFLQLFTVGSVRLNMDGTPVVDGNGNPVANYTENDVRQLARALTGWAVNWDDFGAAWWYPWNHDPNNKIVMGTTIVGRSGEAGRQELDDVANIIMANPSTAPFISKMLIQKLATETPTPGYVQRVASTFAQTNGDLKQTVRAILVDPEFTSAAVIRTQYKTPIEQFIAVTRALRGSTQGHSYVDFARDARHHVYFPPSVFSFFRPGNKKALVNTALAITRDSVGDELTNGFTDENGYRDTAFSARDLIDQYHLTKPSLAVDFLSDSLLAAPLKPEVRRTIIEYIGTTVTETRFRGAAWLIICSPDFQLN